MPYKNIEDRFAHQRRWLRTPAGRAYSQRKNERERAQRNTPPKPLPPEISGVFKCGHAFEDGNKTVRWYVRGIPRYGCLICERKRWKARPKQKPWPATGIPRPPSKNKSRIARDIPHTKEWREQESQDLVAYPCTETGVMNPKAWALVARRIDERQRTCYTVSS